MDVAPRHGDLAGGGTLTITGEGFGGVMSVEVDGVPCASVVVVDSTTLTAEAPPGVAGPADVTVTFDDAAERTLPDGYLYDGFGPDAPIAPDGVLPHSRGLQLRPTVAIGTGVVHAVWLDTRSGATVLGVTAAGVYHARSTDDGATWSASRLLSPTYAGSPAVPDRGPALACDGSVVAAAWRELAFENGAGTVFVAVSRDGGLSWDPPFQVDAAPGSTPCVAVSGNRIAVAWCGTDAFARVSLNGGQTWGSTVLLNHGDATGSAQTNPRLALSGTTVAVAWEDQRGSLDGTGRAQDVYARISADGGLTWRSEVLLSTDANGTSADQSLPFIAASGANVIAVWRDGRGVVDGTNDGTDIRARRSGDAGATWGAEVRLNQDATGTGASQDTPVVAISGLIAVAAWQDGRGQVDGSGSGTDLHARASADGGATWAGADLRLSGDAGLQANPVVAVSSGAVAVGWSADQADTYVARSGDGGLSFAAEQALDPATPFANYELALSAAGARVAAAWRRDDGQDVAGKVSTDGAATWATAAKVINDKAVDPARKDQVKVVRGEDGVLHAVWTDDRGNPRLSGFHKDIDTDVYYARSLDDGATWSPEVRLNDDFNGHLSGPGDQYEPVLAVTGPHVIVAWTDGRYIPVFPAGTPDSGTDIFAAVSHDGGATWSSPNLRVNDDTLGAGGNQFDPTIVASGGTVLIAWVDVREPIYELMIYSARSTDGGTTWEPNAQLSGAASFVYEPALAMEGSTVVVAFGCNGAVDVGARMSTDAGATWSPLAYIDDVTVDAKESIRAAIAGSRGLVAWRQLGFGSPVTLYANSSGDFGQTWSSLVEIRDGTNNNNTTRPNLSASGDLACLVWEDQRNKGAVQPAVPDIYASLSEDGGLSWGANVRLNDDPPFPAAMNQHREPVVAVGGGTVLAAWTDHRGFSDRTTSLDPFAALSLDGGATWVQNQRLPQDAHALEQTTPGISFAFGRVFVWWSDPGQGRRGAHGRSGWLWSDLDGDGLSDAFEGGLEGRDTDADGTPDCRDLDSDGDGRSDASEGLFDSDQDGLPDVRDPGL